MSRSSQHLTDEELIQVWQKEPDEERRRLLAGRLFQRYEQKLTIWCLRFAGDREAAADLVQEIFMKVYQHLEDFRQESRFLTWLYTIARNHCFNFRRRRALRPSQANTKILDGMADPTGSRLINLIEERSSHQFLLELMEHHLEKLEKEIMVLHYGYEFDLASLTRLFRLKNASGAKAYIVSARRKLARALKRHRARRLRERSASPRTGGK